MIDPDVRSPCTEKSVPGVVVPTPTLPCEVTTKAVEVLFEVEVETAKSGMLERVEVAEILSLAQGEVVEIPREAGVAFQKRFELSWVRRPFDPMKGTEPWVREVVKEEVATRVPNCPLPPSTKEPVSPAVEARPPAKVEVAEEVEVIEPVVREPVESEEKTPETERRRVEKREVVVAFVVVELSAMKVVEAKRPLVSQSGVVVALVVVPKFVALTNAFPAPPAGSVPQTTLPALSVSRA